MQFPVNEVYCTYLVVQIYMWVQFQNDKGVDITTLSSCYQFTGYN